MGDRGPVHQQAAINDAVVNRAKAEYALAEFEQPLIRYVQMFVGNLETARDIVGDAFLKLCQTEQSMEAEHVKSWLFRVCRNGAIDFCRKEKRMASSSINVSEVVGEREQQPAGKLEQAELVGQVMARVQSLSNNQQEVLRLKFQSGFSYQEIAEVTGLTKSNVGVLLHTALTKLRAQLQSS